MKTELFFLLFLIKPSDETLYSCNQNSQCGCSANPISISRIVGGEAAENASWTWIVSLSTDASSLCGGSIISDSWIVTAAHCFSDDSAPVATVYAGSNIRHTGTQIRTSSRVIIHNQFNPISFENDIALIQVSPPLNLSDPYVDKICLPMMNASILNDAEWPPANLSVVAIGWGRLSTNGMLPASLQQVTVRTVGYRETSCSRLVANWTLQLCAGIPGSGKDTCQGDSGGPLMMFNSLRQWELVGITSTGAECASAQYAGVYTRVLSFGDWIREHTSDVSATTNPPFTTSTPYIPPIISRANNISRLSCIQLLFLIFIWMRSYLTNE